MGAVVTGSSGGATSAYLGDVPAATGAANYFGQVAAHITNYASGANYKPMQSSNAMMDGTNVEEQNISGLWLSTAGIARITIYCLGGNLDTDSLAMVYGLP